MAVLSYAKGGVDGVGYDPRVMHDLQQAPPDLGRAAGRAP